MRIFKKVAVGGTFDHFHKGHQVLLEKAFTGGLEVIVGVTGEKMVGQKRLTCLILPYEKRVQELKNFLKKSRFLNSTQIIKLSDFAGIAAQDPELKALIVTKETLFGGQRVNRLRVKKDLKPLILIEADFVTSQDGRYLSSARIREGKVNRQGQVYNQNLDALGGSLTSSLRKILQKPWGRLLEGEGEFIFSKVKKIFKKKPFFWATVGDVTTKFFREKGYRPNLAIIDGKVAQVKLGKEFLSTPKVVNPPGEITPQLLWQIDKILEKICQGGRSEVILIEGEEDLAVLPLILFSPLESLIFYGQPGKGLVVLKVEEETKEKVWQILRSLKR